VTSPDSTIINAIRCLLTVADVTWKTCVYKMVSVHRIVRTAVVTEHLVDV